MKTNLKPLPVKAAIIYFGTVSLLSLIGVLYISVFGGEIKVLSVIPLILFIPNAIGFTILLLKPEKWHRNYCSIVGNIFGFAGLISELINFTRPDHAFLSVIGIIISIGVLAVFLSFEFNKNIKQYFGK